MVEIGPLGIEVYVSEISQEQEPSGLVSNKTQLSPAQKKMEQDSLEARGDLGRGPLHSLGYFLAPQVGSPRPLPGLWGNIRASASHVKNKF